MRIDLGRGCACRELSGRRSATETGKRNSVEGVNYVYLIGRDRKYWIRHYKKASGKRREGAGGGEKLIEAPALCAKRRRGFHRRCWRCRDADPGVPGCKGGIFDDPTQYDFSGLSS